MAPGTGQQRNKQLGNLGDCHCVPLAVHPQILSTSGPFLGQDYLFGVLRCAGHEAGATCRASGAGVVHRPSQLRRPSDKITHTAFQASPELIFELPRTRSTNVMGVSPKRLPARFNRQRISS